MAPTKPLIAIVDDEESVRRALTRLIRSAGLEPVSFSSGSNFVAFAETQSPACLVLDLHMPGMDGFEVQTRLAGLGATIPVVVITGLDSPGTRRKAMACSPVAYLRKPVDGRVLLKAIQQAVGGAVVPVDEDHAEQVPNNHLNE